MLRVVFVLRSTEVHPALVWFVCIYLEDLRCTCLRSIPSFPSILKMHVSTKGTLRSETLLIERINGRPPPSRVRFFCWGQLLNCCSRLKDFCTYLSAADHHSKLQTCTFIRSWATVGGWSDDRQRTPSEFSRHDPCDHTFHSDKGWGQFAKWTLQGPFGKLAGLRYGLRDGASTGLVTMSRRA